MPKKKAKRGSKSSGQYVGLLNALTRENKAKAKKIRLSKGVTKAIAFARKHRKRAK